MAWNYARYIGYVAAQGKKEYPLPMYVNAWLVQPSDHGPGDYPSGGREPLVHDIWRAGAPAIDILAPDIYLPEFAQNHADLRPQRQPGLQSRNRQDREQLLDRLHQLNALCVSHIGIDNFNDWLPESAYARTYSLLGRLSGAIAEAQGKKDAIKLITLAEGQNPGKVQLGNYMFDFTQIPSGRRSPRGKTSYRGDIEVRPSPWSINWGRRSLPGRPFCADHQYRAR